MGKALLDLNVLYVDSDIDKRFNFENYFQGKVTKVISAKNLVEGLQKGSLEYIDLVVTQENLSLGDGFSLVKKLREINTYLQAIIVTELDKKILNKLSTVDMLNDYITNDFTFAEVLQILKDNLDKMHERRDLRKKQNLSIQYANAIDNSAIVSKTDPSGIITYVNDAFCQISGFSKEELIGKSHKIIRHPDTPKSLFEEMWRYIKTKMVFKTNIKNKAKDGSAYYTYTTVLPILDENREISEFIAIRFDTTQLEESIKEAQSAKESQSTFLANMSHEIRTPLNAIFGFSELMKQNKSLDEENKEQASIIHSSADSLLNLINEILDIAKIQSGKIELEYIHFNPLKEFQQIEKLFSAKANEKMLNFSFNIENELPKSIVGDKYRIKQVLSNLVSNAIKFTPDYGDVTVNIYTIHKNTTCKLQFEVIDSGIGISNDVQEKIFQPFTQAASSTTREFGGTGLGLTISNDILHLMDSKLFLESSVGEGSMFSFILEFEFDDEKDNEEDCGGGVLQSYDASILVAEDVLINQKLIRTILDQRDIKADIVDNGFRAVQTFKENGNNYDLVFLDINMPVMDGVDACKKINEIKNQEAMKFVPVVALTANAISGDKEKYIEAGFDHYLAKPIEVKELDKLLNYYLRKKVKAKKTVVETVAKDTLKEEMIETAKDIIVIDKQKIADQLQLPIEFYDELINDFLNIVDDEMKTLKEYIEKNDYKNIHSQAHKLKGLCANMYFEELTQLYKDMEQNAKNNTEQNYLQEYEKMQNTLNRYDFYMDFKS
jgi:PAS domain S-box-containing protein